MTTKKQPIRAKNCAICRGICPTPQACEVPEENRFDHAFGFIRDVLAGVGLLAVLIFVFFNLGRAA
jgi:hypothetical protein